jgi:hypothetical protein
MFSRTAVYRTQTPMPTLLHRHLDQGLAAMARTDGLLVLTEAYDVLAVAAVRLLDHVPADATVEDLRAAFATRATLDAATKAP